MKRTRRSSRGCYGRGRSASARMYPNTLNLIRQRQFFDDEAESSSSFNQNITPPSERSRVAWIPGTNEETINCEVCLAIQRSYVIQADRAYRVKTLLFFIAGFCIGLIVHEVVVVFKAR